MFRDADPESTTHGMLVVAEPRRSGRPIPDRISTAAILWKLAPNNQRQGALNARQDGTNPDLNPPWSCVSKAVVNSSGATWDVII